ncbi:MAG: glutamyl-tRNA reductase [Candidatus Omnitrophica bacterium]|nr:glutamyl-tRNA reductase [Candidatus Omnitrophota bacterium]
MGIAVVGLNHRTAPVAVREKLAFPHAGLEDAYRRLRSIYGIEEAVILSTCNRVEIYAQRSAGPLGEELEAFLGSFHGIKRERFAASLYHYHEMDAIRHLFSVSSSLDSMVIGESEIVGQVKQAYRVADENGMCGKQFHHIFQKSFQVSKRVRTETGISQGAVSVSSIALDLARKIFGSVWGKEVLIIGTGKMSAKTALLLKQGGVGRVMVVSRTEERACDLARAMGGVALAAQDLDRALARADIVIASSTAPQFLVRRATLEGILPARGFRPLLFVDLGVPRNVDPEVGQMSQVLVYDIDSLAAISEENACRRQADLHRGLMLVDEKAGQVAGWLNSANGRADGPQSLRPRAESVPSAQAAL